MSSSISSYIRYVLEYLLYHLRPYGLHSTVESLKNDTSVAAVASEASTTKNVQDNNEVKYMKKRGKKLVNDTTR